MRSTKAFKWFLIFSIMLCLVGGLLISSAHAEFFLSKVTRVIPRANGDTFVQFTSVDGKFNGIARGLIDGADPGANQLLASFLTAMALNANISIEMANTPSFNNIQVITSAGVAAP